MELSNGEERQQLVLGINNNVGSNRNDRNDDNENGCCCRSFFRFHNVNMAKGYALNGSARGVIIMSNIFLSTSLIYLATNQANSSCLSTITTTTTLTEEKEEDLVLLGEEKDNNNNNNINHGECDGKIYGQTPASYIANISVISGLLSALFMPFFGTLFDCTSYRRIVGIIAAIVLVIVQFILSYTTQQTWLYMSYIQPISGFLYQIEVLAAFSYLPEMARIVGETTMTTFQGQFSLIIFAAEGIFLILVVLISKIYTFDDVQTAQTSQLLTVIFTTITYTASWMLLPTVPAKRQLRVEENIFTSGFIQTLRTARRICITYKHSLRHFLLAVIFEEAAVAAFVSISVIFLQGYVGLSSSEIGIFFFISLCSAIPGTILGEYITSKIFNPKYSLILSLISIAITTIMGALIVNDHHNHNHIIIYIWGLCIGLNLGWFFPVENLFFSMCIPKDNGQDSEYAGFFVYCTQVLVWLPPLVFSTVVQYGMNQKYGLLSIVGFLFVAIMSLITLPSWSEILDDVHKTDTTTTTTTTHENHNNNNDENNNHNNNINALLSFVDDNNNDTVGRETTNTSAETVSAITNDNTTSRIA